MPLIFELKVMPQSGKLALVLDKSGILKAFVKAAPEDGKANKELVELIAQALDFKKQQIEIIAGLTSRKKKIVVHADISYQDFLNKAGLVCQQVIFTK